MLHRASSRLYVSMYVRVNGSIGRINFNNDRYRQAKKFFENVNFGVNLTGASIKYVSSNNRIDEMNNSLYLELS